MDLLFEPQVESEGASQGQRLRLQGAAGPLTMAQVLSGWRHSGAFRDAFNQALAGSPYTAFRWETPPVTRATITRPFECVLLDSPALRVAPDPHTFATHFGEARAPAVVRFANLGGDATLVVPAPGEPLSAYPHIGAFVRAAPPAQRDALWHEVGEALQARLGDTPVWLNTAGTGVAWLHVRLDERPKYYLHAPYREDAR